MCVFYRIHILYILITYTSYSKIYVQLYTLRYTYYTFKLCILYKHTRIYIHVYDRIEILFFTFLFWKLITYFLQFSWSSQVSCYFGSQVSLRVLALKFVAFPLRLWRLDTIKFCSERCSWDSWAQEERCGYRVRCLSINLLRDRAVTVAINCHLCGPRISGDIDLSLHM